MASSNGNVFRVVGLFMWGIHQSPVNSPYKGQWRRALMFSLICAWINGWVNNREAGDLWCHRAHYDVIAMGYYWFAWSYKIPEWYCQYSCQLSLPDRYLLWPFYDGVIIWKSKHWSVASPHKSPVTRCFNIFFDVSLNNLLNTQPNCGWFETPWHSCDDADMPGSKFIKLMCKAW